MQRWELERRIALLLGESPDTPGYGEPMWLREACGDAVDHVTRQTDYYETYFTGDLEGLTTPVQRLCLPDRLYKLREVQLTGADSKYYQFLPRKNIYTATALGRMYPNWRTDVQGGTPTALVLAEPDLWCWPRVNYDAVGGIRFFGFATHPRSWSESSPAAAPTRTDVFPLPPIAMEAVTHFAAHLRCIQFPTKENQARMPHLWRTYESELGRACRAAAQNRESMH